MKTILKKIRFANSTVFFGMRSKFLVVLLLVGLLSFSSVILGASGIRGFADLAERTARDTSELSLGVKTQIEAIHAIEIFLRAPEKIRDDGGAVFLEKVRSHIQNINSLWPSTESLFLPSFQATRAFLDSASRAGELYAQTRSPLPKSDRARFEARAEEARTAALSLIEATEVELLKATELLNAEALARADEIEGLKKTLQTSIFLLSLGGTILSLFLGIVFAEYALLRPLRRLSVAAASFGKGKFSTRVEVRANDEVGALAKAFNMMAANIASTTVALEEKVADRTKSLEDRVGVGQKQLEDFKKINDELVKSTKLLVRRDLELSRANERLRELDSTKSEFISIVAHQLRTPLSGMKWMIDTLLSGKFGTLQDSHATMLMKTYESNERMISFVNDLLDVDRIETGKFKYNFTKINLADLADNVIFEVNPQAFKKKVTIIFSHASGELPKVSVDTEKMRMVFQNVLENAVKYTPEGGRVDVHMEREGERLHVTVRDSGIGVPKASLEKIFARFYRAPNAMRISADGSGLGLFISKKIIERHNGLAWFETEEGRGFTFHFSLPM